MSQNRLSATLDTRLDAVSETVREADRWRSSGKNRRVIVLGWVVTGVLSILALLLLIGFLYFRAKAYELGYRRATGPSQVSEFVSLVSAAFSTSTGEPRNISLDRVAFAAVTMPSKMDPEGFLVADAHLVFRETVRVLDRSVRNTFSDMLIQILENRAIERRDLQDKPADCAVIRSNDRAILIGEGGRGFKSEPIPDAVGSSLSGSWQPAVWPLDQRVASYSPITDVWPVGSIVCLSHNSNWLMVWVPGQGSAPGIRRVSWIRTSHVADPESQWHVAVGKYRSVVSAQSYADGIELSRSFGKVVEKLRNWGAIRSFHVGGQAGFLIPIGNENRTAIVWTSTGLSDPDDQAAGTVPELVSCPSYNPVPVLSRELMKCDLESGTLGNEVHNYLRLIIEFYPGDPGADRPAGETAMRYSSPNYLCSSTIRLEFPKMAGRGNNRAAIEHVSSQIEAAAIVGDYLWLRDVNGQVWRYIVGVTALGDVIKARWTGYDQKLYGPEVNHSAAACERLPCLKWLKEADKQTNER
jgi:hypothetical protein